MKVEFAISVKHDRLPTLALGMVVERPYPTVPRHGEHVVLDDEGTAQATVKDVTYQPDGSVLLELEPWAWNDDDCGTLDDMKMLAEAGFRIGARAYATTRWDDAKLKAVGL